MLNLSREERLIILVISSAILIGSFLRIYNFTHETKPPAILVETKRPAPVIKPVNINTDGEYELDRLPGIGPALASRIIAYREANGAFIVKEDLTKVGGVGKAKFEKLKDLVILEDGRAE